MSRFAEEDMAAPPVPSLAQASPTTTSKWAELDDISTSESESETEGEADEKSSQARSPEGSPEPAPEVKCMWEDCGETFTDLQPFIAHLHSCTLPTTTHWQSILVFTNHAMLVNGPGVHAKARAKHPALLF